MSNLSSIILDPKTPNRVMSEEVLKQGFINISGEIFKQYVKMNQENNEVFSLSWGPLKPWPATQQLWLILLCNTRARLSGASYLFDDMIITGMGDTVFANNITRRSYNDAGSFYVNFSSYIKPSTVNVPYGSCDLIVHHLNHGPLINRQYNNINQILNSTFAQNGLKKIDDVLCRRDDGILQYKPEYLPLFNHIMLTYFKIRNDDFAYFA